MLSGSERQQAKVYESPDENSAAIAEVTYESQAVHVLEQGAEWTKIEGYSSSVEGSSVANYAGHFVGYVPTSLLKEKEVNQHLGVVIDKAAAAALRVPGWSAAVHAAVLHGFFPRRRPLE